MTSIAGERLREAASFLVPEIRAALCSAPGGAIRRHFPPDPVALLWCDIAGFSRLTDTLLTERPDGVEELHRQLLEHYDALVALIVARGGEPVSFIGDGLLSIWRGRRRGLAAAVTDAVATGLRLADLRKKGDAALDLNLHVAAGLIQTVELGGRHDRWLAASFGSAVKNLRAIAGERAPNTVLVTAEAASAAGDALLSEPFGDGRARAVRAAPGALPTAPATMPTPGAEAWRAVISRTPRSVARWIETVGLQWLAQLRPVSAVTIALPGFDETAADTAERLDRLVRLVQEIVHARDGAVADVLFDDKGASLVVTFGAPPDAHTDDPLRAVLSAAEIVEALAAAGERAGVGIATGRAFCGIVGNDDRRCSLLLGDVMILSSRLAWAADGDILLDPATVRATGHAVVLAGKPLSLSLKGQRQPMQAWSVAAIGRRGDAGEATAGRDAEVSMLRRLWADTLSRGGGAGVVIEGQPGFGKTSLALDLGRRVERDGGQFRIETAAAIERGTPYGTLRRTIAEVLGIAPGMGLAERAAAVLAALPETLRDRAPLIDAVVPTGLDDNAHTRDLTGQARAEMIEDVLAAVLSRAFAGHPVCLCIDDGQWLDGPSRRLLLRLREELPRLMVLILVQQGGDVDWIAELVAEGLHHVRLRPLERDGLAALIAARTGAEAVSPALVDRVAHVTEGHPFFSVELVASLVEHRSVTVEQGCAVLSATDTNAPLALPSSLHGMVLQRLDRPEPAEQLALRVGSVAGKVFPTRLVSEVHPLPTARPRAARHLFALAKMGLLEPVAAGDLPGYCFLQGLVREVAYSQFPFDQRTALHRDIAGWLEANAGAERASKLMELAHHWLQGGVPGRAVDMLLEESLRLFRQGYAAEAVDVGLEAIRVAGVTVPATPEAMGAVTAETIAAVEAHAAGRDPSALIAAMGPPSDSGALALRTLLSTAPFAFQSNRFAVFAWTSATAVRLALDQGGGPPHAFSMYSIVKAALTGDRVGAAAWSAAALELDRRTGGGALPAVGFIDTWFHGHWRAPLHESVARNRAAAARALADGDGQYASYNIAGEVVMRAALGEPLSEVAAACDVALGHHLHRNARVHVLMERQFARALQGLTGDLLSLTCNTVDEERDIAWILSSEFANQIGYYLATRVRLHRHAGDWAGALAVGDRIGPVLPAIAGQIAEVDAVFHVALARMARLIEGGAGRDAEAASLAGEIDRLRAFRALHAGNFGLKAGVAETIREGLDGNPAAAAERLAALGASVGARHALQDRALALEYAARLSPGGPYRAAAVAAYEAWGATEVARRLAQTLG